MFSILVVVSISLSTALCQSTDASEPGKDSSINHDVSHRSLQQASCSCSSPYTVKPGDGMYAIAQRCGGGLTVASISAANGITNPDLIQPGQKLVLPGCGGGSTGESFCMTTRAHTRVTGCHAPVSA